MKVPGGLGALGGLFSRPRFLNVFRCVLKASFRRFGVAFGLLLGALWGSFRRFLEILKMMPLLHENVTFADSEVSIWRRFEYSSQNWFQCSSLSRICGFLRFLGVRFGSNLDLVWPILPPLGLLGASVVHYFTKLGSRSSPRLPKSSKRNVPGLQNGPRKVPPIA